ncbi:hypothetical protein HU200_031428 [Digitaria exilis]|uniref:Uncharacterized protein n=1 Tax=Digitaria exilis TaxID=1010633 RepID=A0A835EQ86_9POAL|nr:hypothetical protein HU200_031428 [Digitaria exilis]
MEKAHVHDPVQHAPTSETRPFLHSVQSLPPHVGIDVSCWPLGTRDHPGEETLAGSILWSPVSDLVAPETGWHERAAHRVVVGRCRLADHNQSRALPLPEALVAQRRVAVGAGAGQAYVSTRLRVVRRSTQPGNLQQRTHPARYGQRPPTGSVGSTAVLLEHVSENWRHLHADGEAHLTLPMPLAATRSNRLPEMPIRTIIPFDASNDLLWWSDTRRRLLYKPLAVAQDKPSCFPVSTSTQSDNHTNHLDSAPIRRIDREDGRGRKIKGAFFGLFHARSSTRNKADHHSSSAPPMAVSVAHPSTEEEEKEVTRNKKRSSILGSLREAIKKVRFLLSFSATRWMLLTSVVGARGTAAPARRLSFDSRPGLLDVDGSSPASSRTSRSASMGTATTKSLSRTSSSTASPPQVLTRASSSSGGGSPASLAAAGDDDIDRRAEQFIANFYKQLQMERQVSLQLRYVRGNSWDWTP